MDVGGVDESAQRCRLRWWGKVLAGERVVSGETSIGAIKRSLGAQV